MNRGVKSKRFLNVHLIKIETASNEYLKDQIWIISDLLKNKRQNNKEDIRQYSVCKNRQKLNNNFE